MTKTRFISMHGKFLWLGIFFGAIFWVLEALIHVVIFSQYGYVKELFAPDAHEAWMRMMVSCLFIVFGGVVQMAINRRKLVEEALRESEKQYKTLFDSAGDAIFVHDMRGRFLDVNQVVCERYGYSREEMLSMSSADLDSPEDLALVAKRLHRLEAEGRICFEALHRIKSGALIPTEATVRLIDYVGQPAALCIARDITERKKMEQVLELERRQMSVILSSLDTGLSLINQDMTIAWVNEKIRDMFSHADPVGQVCYRFYQKQDTPCEQCAVQQTLESGKVSEIDHFNQEADRWYRIVAQPVLDEDGNIVSVLESLTDITGRKLMEEALRRSEERYRTVADFAHDFETWQGPDNKMLYVSPSSEKITGYAPERFIEDPDFIQRIIHRDDLFLWKRHMSDQSRQAEDCVDFRIIHADGRIRWLCQVTREVQDENGNPLGVRCSLRDITGRKTMEQQLRHQALHDPLTGLANRTLCLDHIRKAIERSKRREKYYYAVVFMDLDRFKVVNDSLGHTAGDKVLRKVRDRLLRNVRSVDTVSRFGGDEFILLLDELESPKEAMTIMRRIREEFQEPLYIDGYEVRTTTSLGAVLSPTSSSSPEELIRNANIAMYRAKEFGRNRIKVFNSRMLTLASQVMIIENELRRAIRKNEFFIQYQPIQLAKDSRLVGFEALVRWQHPEKGVIFPMDFIRTLEETGLIVELGQWVLENACSTMAAWRKAMPAAKDLFLNVNISAKQFSQPKLDLHLANILEKTHLPPDRLELEITETAIMENAEDALLVLKKLKNLGVRISIDDFGTGYSSLSYLQRFPVDTLKVDRSFISQIFNDQENLEIVRSVIALAQSLGLDVVAEGVENSEQLSLLKELNCGSVQGFYFFESMDPQDIASLIQTLPARTEHSMVA